MTLVVKVIAHRGWSGKYPENTLLAFREAIRIGVPGVEFDVQTTVDGHLVVFHDTTLDRTTNGHGAVQDHTLEQIRALDAGQGERVPTFEETLDLCVGKVSVQVELKASAVRSERHIANLWAQYGARPDFYFTSFDQALLGRLKKENPQIPVAILEQVGSVRSGHEKEQAEKIVVRAKAIDAYATHIKFPRITPELLQACQAENLLMRAWGVERKVTPNQIRASGVEGFTTNWPDQYLCFMTLVAPPKR